MRITQSAADDLQWLILERRVEVPPPIPGSQLSCKIVACASEGTNLNVVFIAKTGHGTEKRSELAAPSLSTRFSEFNVSASLDDHDFGFENGPALLRIVIVFEIKAGLQVDIRDWEINVGYLREGGEVQGKISRSSNGNEIQ